MLHIHYAQNPGQLHTERAHNSIFINSQILAEQQRLVSIKLQLKIYRIHYKYGALIECTKDLLHMYL